VEEIDEPGEAMRPIILDCRGRFRPRRRIGPISRDQRTAAVREHDQQQSDAAPAQDAHNWQSATLERVPLTNDSH
jgi:hypothetical protein